MISLLLVMQRACLCYYTIITYSYVIITPGSIITHYFNLQNLQMTAGSPPLPPQAKPTFKEKY